MKDAREELDEGRGGGRVGCREGREREVVHREGAYLACSHLSEVLISGTRHLLPAPHAFLGRHVKDEHVKDAAQDVAEGAAEGVP